MVPEAPTTITSQTSPQSNTPKSITLVDVLDKLSEKEKRIILDCCPDSTSDIRTAVDSTLHAAEDQKQRCIRNRWEVKVGKKTIALRSKADKMIAFTNKVKDVGTMIASVDPVHAGLPWAAVCVLLQMVVADANQMQALLDGISTALSTKLSGDLYLELYQKQPTGAGAGKLREDLVSLYTVVFRFLAKPLSLPEKSRARLFLSAITEGDGLQNFTSDCRTALDDVERTAQHCDRDLATRISAQVAEVRDTLDEIHDTLRDIHNETEDIKIKLDLHKLPVASGAQFDSSEQEWSVLDPSQPGQKKRCLPGTREGLLEDMQSWVDDPTSECFLWVSGGAGLGKSTVALTFAEKLEAQNQLGASFCFRSDHHERGNANKFFSTIASQLTRVITGLKRAIAKVLDAEPGRYEKGLSFQFEDFLETPLQTLYSSLTSSNTTSILVVDALDECVDAQVADVIKLLAKLHQVTKSSVRIMLTSRPTSKIQTEFAVLDRCLVRRLDMQGIDRGVVEGDITRFFQDRLSELRKNHFELRADWPGQEATLRLIKRSVPLFIYAHTVCEFLGQPGASPEEQLEAVLEESTGPQLSMMYLPILKACIRHEVGERLPKARKVLLNIIGPIVLSAEPLPYNLVLRLCTLKHRNQLTARLNMLQSVVLIENPAAGGTEVIRPLHLSFRDFLTEPGEPHDFIVDQLKIHEQIASSCLEIMMQPGNLQQDICRLKEPGIRRLDVNLCVINEHIKPDLAYACNHWVYHLEKSCSTIDDTHEIVDFLHSYFLYWFEVISWLGKAGAIVILIRRLRKLSKVRHIISPLSARWLAVLLQSTY